ncbi:MAG: biotin-dependent carboxyltransferase family protein [Desulfopila sp.]
MIPVLTTLSAGPLTTVQDLGRGGAAQLGVPFSGALDPYAHRLANWLVGNSEGAATLEMTMAGSTVEFLCEADIAITGAAMNPYLNGAAVRQWCSLRVKAGDRLELGFAENGCRAYLAIGGGIAVPEVLGSRSTYLGGELGGLQGRALADGDLLARGAASPLAAPRQLPWVPIYPQSLSLRVVVGPHDQFFATALAHFFAATFTVTPKSDRMGCRLSGPVVERDPGAPASILSEPVTPGNIQIPADGQPIVLLSEQTIGGYTCIATVVSGDLWRIGQACPGDAVGFVEVSLDTAHHILKEWQCFVSDARILLEAGWS